MPHRFRIYAVVTLAATIALAAMLGGEPALSASSHDQEGATVPSKNGLIAFRRYFGSDHTTGAVFTISASGKGGRQLTRPGRGLIDDQPDWSPDGSLIAFERKGLPGDPQALYTIEPDGSNLTRISPSCSYSGPEYEEFCEDGEDAHFLPDGSGLTYTRVTGTRKNGTLVLQKDIAARDLDGGNLRTLIDGRGGSDCFEGQVAPDGDRISFVCEASGRRLAVFVAKIDGTGQSRLTPWSLYAGDDPDWSPDGKLILFKSYVDGPKQSQLYVVRPDGTGLRRLTHFKPDTIATSASFSPDGKWITFATNGVGGQADVFVMRANGTGIRPVTRTKLWDSAPDWGPAP